MLKRFRFVLFVAKTLYLCFSIVSNMNYIKKLETENLDLKKNQAETSEQITDLLKYLSSDKFAGFENNFVNATEMRLRLTEILNNINC